MSEEKETIKQLSEELKPCPFCGGKAEIERYGNNRQSMQIRCEDCGCFLETGETWIDENCHWNNRFVPENAFEKLMLTVVDISSIEDFGKWIEIAYGEADRLHRNLCEKEMRGEGDSELKEFVSGKINALKTVKHNFDRAKEFEAKSI